MDDGRRITSRRCALATALLAVLVAGVLLVSSALADITSVTDLFKATDVVLITSRTNLPIVTGKRMQPGDTVRGGIKVGNFGVKTGILYVEPRRIVDKAGPRRGHLSWRLMLRIQELKRGGGTRTVWRGYITDLRRIRIGTLKPGQVRRYRFIVKFRMRPPARSPLSENLLMASSYKTDWLFRLVPRR